MVLDYTLGGLQFESWGRRDFFLFLALFCFAFSYRSLSNHLKSPVLFRLGNPKAAAHVAVRPSMLVTVKCMCASLCKLQRISTVITTTVCNYMYNYLLYLQ